MSYVRWSTKVRDNCARCGDTGYVDLDESHPFHDLLQGRGLCRDCSSCWYVYWNVGGFISLHHACDDTTTRLEFDDAADWRPPESCPMGDVALSAVADALADYEAEERELPT